MRVLDPGRPPGSGTPCALSSNVSSAFWFRSCLVSGLAGYLACGTPDHAKTSGDNNVTNIPQSSVLDQGQSGNCWLYATAAWIESLHAARTGDNTLHLSPVYWLY